MDEKWFIKKLRKIREDVDKKCIGRSHLVPHEEGYRSAASEFANMLHSLEQDLEREMDPVYQSDKEKLKIAYNFSTKSKDPSTQTGAIIISPNNVLIGVGYNHLPERFNDDPKVWNDRNLKLEHVIHAEVATINNALSKGYSTEGTTMYMPWVPCTPCAEAIVNAGIVEYVNHQAMVDKTPENWRESTQNALKVLEEAGVKYRTIEGSLDGPLVRFRGKEWRP